MEKEIKCIIWDLDNTLWNGILAEDESVLLKSEIVDIIKQLDERGVLHSIASKNNYQDAMQKLKEFNIAEYFLFPEISWNPKSISVSNIQRNLNIGMDTILFIDDQIFERDEVKCAHPDISCLDATNCGTILSDIRFQKKYITEDSAKRRQMYLTDIRRKEDEEQFCGTPEAFLAHLDITFIISEAQEIDLLRAIELTERTHQLNTTGYTYDYDELNFYRASEDHMLLVCEMTDRYGSYGKIGLALIEIQKTYNHLKLLLMSCRVISRGVGTILLSYIMQRTKQENKYLLADFKKNEKNKMMYATYKFANFQDIESNNAGITILRNDLSIIQMFPPYVRVEIKN